VRAIGGFGSRGEQAATILSGGRAIPVPERDESDTVDGTRVRAPFVPGQPRSAGRNRCERVPSVGRPEPITAQGSTGSAIADGGVPVAGGRIYRRIRLLYQTTYPFRSA